MVDLTLLFLKAFVFNARFNRRQRLIIKLLNGLGSTKNIKYTYNVKYDVDM